VLLAVSRAQQAAVLLGDFMQLGAIIDEQVRTAQRPDIQRWLRANDADRDRYADVKRELAQRAWRHVQHYANAKTAVVQEIMQRADAAG
jgi:GrpB-like predicted nucleotidyltransferase (UPF0157 family)